MRAKHIKRGFKKFGGWEHEPYHSCTMVLNPAEMQYNCLYCSNSIDMLDAELRKAHK